MNLLKFSFGNAKLRPNVGILNLSAGVSCPGAEKCLAMVRHGKIWDGPKQEFRCYAASVEALYPQVFKNNKDNLDLIKGKAKDELVPLIQNSLPIKKGTIRLHASGDFINQDYFDAWIEVARCNPNILFYAYTKSIHFWVNRLGWIPKNLVLTASYGGKYDNLIEAHSLKNANVVLHPSQAKNNIDHDDSLAQSRRVKNFSLLIHGMQKAGSKAQEAKNRLKREGWNGYGRK